MNEAAEVLVAMGAAGLCPCGQELNGADIEYQDEDNRRLCTRCWNAWVKFAVDYLKKAILSRAGLGNLPQRVVGCRATKPLKS